MISVQVDPPELSDLEADISKNISYAKSIREKITAAQESIKEILIIEGDIDESVQRQFMESNRCLFEALRMVHIQHGIFRTMQVPVGPSKHNFHSR